MRLFVGIPCYDGKVCAETVRSLLDEQAGAGLAGVEMRTAFLSGCSLITHARNQICADFLASDCDKLVFIDSDVAWELGSLLKLAGHDVDVVGGAYRLKDPEEAYPVTWTSDPELIAVNGLLSVQTLPGGFLAVTRSALERLREAHPDRAYEHKGGLYHGWFHAPIGNGLMCGEDAAFCLDWLGLGEKVWLDPELTLTHVGGSNEYIGRIGDWLRTR